MALSQDRMEPHARQLFVLARLLGHSPATDETNDGCTALYCHTVADTVPLQGDFYTQ